MHVSSNRNKRSLFNALILILLISGPALRSAEAKTTRAKSAPKSKSQPKPPSKKPEPAKQAEAPTVKIAPPTEYSLEMANQIIIQGIMMPQEMHFKVGRLPNEQKKFMISNWARNWMDSVDPFKVFFLAADENFVGTQILRSFQRRDLMAQIYQSSVIQIESLFKHRYDEYQKAAQEILANHKLDIRDKETLILDPEKSKRPETYALRSERIRQIFEANLVAYILSGDSEAEAYKKLADALKVSDSQKQKTLSNRNDQVARFVDSYLKTLDPHSDFMAPSTAKQFQSGMERNFFGVGIQIAKDDVNETVVQAVIDESPAQRAGLLKDDLILGYYAAPKEITSFKEMEIAEVSSILRGEKDTSVKIRVRRSIINVANGEAKKSDFDVTIVRGPISQDANRARATLYSFANQKIASISARQFYDGLTEDIETILLEVKKNQELTGIIIDLSGNGGGLLPEAVNTTGLFVGTAPVTQAAFLGAGPDGHGIRIRQMRDEDSKKLFDVPMLVKVDHGSASASEIVAAALQDLGRALVVGEATSFGKGTIQNVFPALINPLEDKNSKLDPLRFGILKFTTGAFYRITGQTTQFQGVHADLPIYSENVSYYSRMERELPEALKPDSIAPDAKFDANSNRYFTADLRQSLANLNRERILQNQEIRMIEADAIRSRALGEAPVNLNLNERTDDRAKAITEQKSLLETLTATHPIDDLKVSELAFSAGKPKWKAIRGIEDTYLGAQLIYSKQEIAKDALRLVYERNLAEMEAILPVFSDISRLQKR